MRTVQRAVVLVLACLMAAGCARLGQPLDRIALPPGTPDVADILADLAANDARLKTFTAAGTFTLESPDLESTLRAEGGVAYVRPDRLRVYGLHKALRNTIFRLTCVEEEFLLEFPASGDPPYYRRDGEQFESVPFSVAPTDILDEMLMPVKWSELSPEELTVTGFDPSENTVTLAIGPRRRPERIVKVAAVPKWVVVENTRLDDGDTVAVTQLSDYRSIDGIEFPAYMDARFPGEDTRLVFDMRKIQLNADIPEERFRIHWRGNDA